MIAIWHSMTDVNPTTAVAGVLFGAIIGWLVVSRFKT